MTNVSSGGGESHQVSDKYLVELQARHGSELAEIKNKLSVQQDLNSQLMDKIQRFKSQKYISEEHISNSQSLNFLREEAKKLISIIEDQKLTINQLRQIEVSYQKKVKTQSESDDKCKLLLTSQKLEIDSQREKQRGLRDKLDQLQV